MGCTNPYCRLNGCQQTAVCPFYPNVPKVVPSAAVAPIGCICPPTSEQTCKGLNCPRRWLS